MPFLVSIYGTTIIYNGRDVNGRIESEKHFCLIVYPKALYFLSTTFIVFFQLSQSLMAPTILRLFRVNFYLDLIKTFRTGPISVTVTVHVDR